MSKRRYEAISGIFSGPNVLSFGSSKRSRTYGGVRVRRQSAPKASRGFYGSRTRLKRMVEGFMEKKVIDLAANTYACDNVGTLTALNLVATGSDFTQRIGRRITIKTVQLEGMLGPVDSTTNMTKVQMWLVYDSQPNGVLPAITDFMSQSRADAFLNLNNRDRFKVLWNLSTTLGGNNNIATQPYQAPAVANVSVYKKCSLPVVYDGAGATMADVQTGAVYLICLGNQIAGTGAAFTGSTRIRFVDA